MKVLIALGGNALIAPGQTGLITEQAANADSALGDVARLLADGHKVILTHGNGFQVGNVLTRSEAARGRAYEIPLHVADAQTQGEIGYIFQQALRNHLEKIGIIRRVATVLTQVLVDPSDPAFSTPSKPIGNYHDKARMEALKREDETWIEDSGRGWRRLVPSPVPNDIIERFVIRDLFEQGAVVITCGGGGIPVIRRSGRLLGIDAVIDKDLASALLARLVGVERLIILTGVDRVALDFGTPKQKWLDRMTVQEAKKHFDEGQFPPGSMGPKIEAAVQFLTHQPDGEVIITSVQNLYGDFYGSGGTRIV